jgi:redox-sensitive bicupin YhaK (pirin superfamily)
MLYLECRMPAGSGITLPEGTDELAAYVVDGNVKVDSQSLTSGLLAVARTGKTVRLEATTDSHAMIIGGVRMSRRHIWWNFVATSKERIEQAKRDWRENRFEGIAGETEFIPLPS